MTPACACTSGVCVESAFISLFTKPSLLQSAPSKGPRVTALVIDNLAGRRFPPLSSAVVESKLLCPFNGCRQRLKKHFDRRFCRALVFWSPWRLVHPRHDRRCHPLFRIQCRADRCSLSSREMRAESEERFCCGSVDQRLLAKSSLLSISRLPALIRFAGRATAPSARRRIAAGAVSSTALTWRSARAFAWRRPTEVGAPDSYRALAQCRRRAGDREPEDIDSACRFYERLPNESDGEKRGRPIG